MTALETPYCRHAHTDVDLKTREVICLNCGQVVQVLEPDAPRSPDGNHAIVSAGMVQPLGSSVDVQALNRAKVLNGALKDLFDGGDKKTFWIALTEALREKGYSEAQIAIKSEYLRKAISRERADVWKAILAIVREALGVDV